MFGPIDPTRKSLPQEGPSKSAGNPFVSKGTTGGSKASSTEFTFDSLFGDSLFSRNTTVSKKPASDLFAFDDDTVYSTKSTPTKAPAHTSLFQEDDDLFSTGIQSTSTGNKSSLFATKTLFDTDDDDLFSKVGTSAKKTSQTGATPSPKPTSLDFLLSDDKIDIEDSGSLFGTFSLSKDEVKEQKPLDKPTPRPNLSPHIQAASQTSTKGISESNAAYLERTQPNETWPHLSDLKEVAGSSPTRFIDSATGKTYTQCSYDSEEDAMNAYGAEQLYRKAGARIPASILIQTPKGYTKLTEFVETRPLEDVLSNATAQQKKVLLGKISEHFSVDALLGCSQLDPSMLGIDNEGNVIRLEIPKPFSAKSHYPMEFWEMRNPEAHPGSSSLFSALSIYDIASQIESLHEDIGTLINAAPPEQRALLGERLSQMRGISQQALQMQHDQFKASYTDAMQMHRMALRETGISAQMPQKLNQDPGDYIVTDENGIEFDHLRRNPKEPKDTPTIPYQIAQYMTENGGDPSTIDNWTTHQGINSWSEGAQGVKYFFALQKDIPMNEYYWHDGQLKAGNCYRKLSESNPESFGKSLAMWHAATQELLSNTDFRFNDRKNNSVRVTRTESPLTLSKNGIRREGTYPRYKMGPNESGSIFTSVTAYAGSSITTQEVPHHAITACYLLGAPPDKIGSPFVNDKENEFLFIPQGIDVTYVSHNNHDVIGSTQEHPQR